MKVISLPNGNQVSLRSYVASWKALKAVPANMPIRGWEWYPMPAGQILDRVSRGVHDRVNKRGGLVMRIANEARINRILQKRVRGECKWCGSAMSEYKPANRRFCCSGCQQDYCN